MKLRCDLFRTMERAETRFICIRDTLTNQDPDFTVTDLDLKHCRQGRFGCGVHFLVLVNGDIQLGRSADTIGSHPRHYDPVSVAVGVVGGLEDGDRLNNRTHNQLEALQDLVEVLMDMYPEAALNDQHLS